MGSPTIRRRQLSGVLRRLRREKSLTLDAVAEKLEWSSAKISNIETGRTARPSMTDIGALLRAYGVQDESREYEEILGLARQSREQGWWTRYGDVLTGAYVGFEAEASRINNYEPMVVPGLLQTEAYAEMHIRSMTVSGERGDVDRAVSARMQRQEILTQENPPELWVIVDENALRRMAALPEAARYEQLERLIYASEDLSNNVTIQVLPLDKSFLTGLIGPFVVLEYEDKDVAPFVFLETDTDGLYLERPEEVTRYHRLFEQAQSIAPGARESADVMRSLIG